MQMTRINMDFWANQPEHKASFANVLHATNRRTADMWFDNVSHYDFCKGYALGSTACHSIPLMLYLILRIIDHAKEPEFIHLLGQSKPSMSIVLNSVATALRKVLPNTELSYDSSTYYQEARYAQVMHGIRYVRSSRRVSIERVPAIAATTAVTMSDLPVPYPSKTFNGVTLKQWLSQTNKSGWDDKSYAMLALHNLEQYINICNYIHDLSDTELLQFDSKSYEEWQPLNTILHEDYYHTHNVIQDIIVNQDYELLKRYENKLNRLSPATVHDDDVFDKLFSYTESSTIKAE